MDFLCGLCNEYTRASSPACLGENRFALTCIHCGGNLACHVRSDLPGALHRWRLGNQTQAWHTARQPLLRQRGHAIALQGCAILLLSPRLGNVCDTLTPVSEQEALANFFRRPGLLAAPRPPVLQ